MGNNTLQINCFFEENPIRKPPLKKMFGWCLTFDAVYISDKAKNETEFTKETTDAGKPKKETKPPKKIAYLDKPNKETGPPKELPFSNKPKKETGPPKELPVSNTPKKERGPPKDKANDLEKILDWACKDLTFCYSVVWTLPHLRPYMRIQMGGLGVGTPTPWKSQNWFLSNTGP